MEPYANLNEDEWSSIQVRFKKEGLEWQSFEDMGRLLQVFRWLVDAESNLKGIRHTNEKLQKQYTEEKQEIQDKAENIRLQCEERIRTLEEETKSLRSELEVLLAGTQAVTNVFSKEKLNDVVNAPLGEQIAYLLVERAQLQEDLANERSNPITDSEKLLRDRLAKTTVELHEAGEKEELSNSRSSEALQKISLLEKKVKELEVHNENLTCKLSETLFEIEGKERLLRDLPNNEVPGSLTSRAKRDSISEPTSMNFQINCKNIRPSESNLENRYQASENPDAASLDSFIQESNNKLNSFLDNQIVNSKSQLTELHEAKKMQNEVSRLKTKASVNADKYENMVKKHNAYKITIAQQLEKQKKEFSKKISELKEEMKQISNQNLLKEEELEASVQLKTQMRKQIDKLEEERRDTISLFKLRDGNLKENEINVSFLQEKLKKLKSSE